jgi:hypothetical protein
VQLSAGGHVLDIRYKVVDPQKAGALAGSSESFYLRDQSTGQTLALPAIPKRQGSRMATGRTYFMLAANTGQFVQPGGRVTLVMGNAQVSDLTVE